MLSSNASTKEFHEELNSSLKMLGSCSGERKAYIGSFCEEDLPDLYSITLYELIMLLKSGDGQEQWEAA